MKITKADVMPKCPKLRGNINILKYPCFVELKLDGEWNMFVKQKDMKPHFINKYGTVRTGGLVDDFAKLFKEDVMILGELYHGDGKKGSETELMKQKESDALRFNPFDIIYYGEHDYKTLPLEERKEILLDLIEEWDGFDINNWCEWADSEDQLQDMFAQALVDGYEGIVAKNMHGKLTTDILDWVKLKGKDTNECCVTKIEQWRERIEVLVEFANEQGERRTRTVGLKVPDEIKVTLKRGDYVYVEHQGILESGSLKHPVYKGKVERNAETTTKTP